jgi:hypothetical protein
MKKKIRKDEDLGKKIHKVTKIKRVRSLMVEWRNGRYDGKE